VDELPQLAAIRSNSQQIRSDPRRGPALL